MPFEMPSAKTLIDKFFGPPSENHVLIDMKDITGLVERGELEFNLKYYPDEGFEPDKKNSKVDQTPAVVPQTRKQKAERKPSPTQTRDKNYGWTQDHQDQQNYSDVIGDTATKNTERRILGVLLNSDAGVSDKGGRNKVPIIPPPAIQTNHTIADGVPDIVVTVTKPWWRGGPIKKHRDW